jgi:hypothetical protein
MVLEVSLHNVILGAWDNVLMLERLVCQELELQDIVIEHIGAQGAMESVRGSDVEGRVVDDIISSRRGHHVGRVEWDGPGLVVADTSGSLQFTAGGM